MGYVLNTFFRQDYRIKLDFITLKNPVSSCNPVEKQTYHPVNPRSHPLKFILFAYFCTFKFLT